MNNNQEINRRFLQEVEQGIRAANNEVIHNKIPPVDSDRMLSFAVSVAKLRLAYIEAAFEFSDNQHEGSDSDGPDAVTQLKIHRERFEEARDAFIALQRAIELGYIATSP